jgi:hypothetical protein
VIEVNSDSYTVMRTVAARVESNSPVLYRLCMTPSGKLYLQGAFQWNQGNAYGHEWRTIPTVIVDVEEGQ